MSDEALPIDLAPARLQEIANRLLDYSLDDEARDVIAAAAHLARLARDAAPRSHDPDALEPDDQFTNPIGRWHVYIGRGPRNVPLYVGTTGCLFDRLGAHQLNAVRDDPDGNWMKYATHIDVIECTSRKAALKLEKDLIAAYQPPANRAGVVRPSQGTMQRGRLRRSA